jgi:hypothetical protein
MRAAALALFPGQIGEDIAGKVQLAAEDYPRGVRYGNACLTPQALAYLKAS